MHQVAINFPRVVLLLMVAASLVAGCTEKAPSESSATVLIQGAVVVDGSGAEAYSADVRIADGLIREVGDLEAEPGDSIVEAQGLTLAPGFIDTHSHADRGLLELPDALVLTSQGITTVVVGQDGGSRVPLSDFFDRLITQGTAVNVASYVGHNTVREMVMGRDALRPATPEEVLAMAELVRQGMAEGALGLSTGLEYDPGIYSETGEVIDLAQAAADAGGRYISHVRSEDRWFEEALAEIIQVGRATGMPVQVSHFKLAMRRLWGKADDIIAMLNEARREGIDVTADLYPYTFWHSNLMVLLPERDYNDIDEINMMLREVTTPAGIRFTDFDSHPEYVGKTLAEVAELRGIDPATAFQQLAAETDALRREGKGDYPSITGESMAEEDIRALLLWPHTNIASDGGINYAHPRGAGTFTKILGRYVREEGLLSLEEAIHKMTGLAAAHMGFTDRGLVRPGMVADLVLLDPETVIDTSTVADSQSLSKGIISVWVSGEQVYATGQATGARPGKVIRRQ